MAGSGGLARIDVSDDDDVNVSLFLSVRDIGVSELLNISGLPGSVKQKTVITTSHHSKQHQCGSSPIAMRDGADADCDGDFDAGDEGESLLLCSGMFEIKKYKARNIPHFVRVRVIEVVLTKMNYSEERRYCSVC